jgi:beta-glucanase (GH16 family)
MTKLYHGLALVAGLFAGLNAYAQLPIVPQRNSYINIGTPVTNPLSKPGWNLVFNDEFSGSKNAVWNTDAWGNHYNYACWGNGFHYAYMKDANQSFTPTTIKFTTKKEGYTPGGGLPVKPNTSASINTDNCNGSTAPLANRFFQYGYFEIRCKNPKGQKMWPAFWLFGSGNAQSSYNEIDIFEHGVGDAVVFTNIYDSTYYHPGNTTRYPTAKWVYSLPGQTFGDTWVTYALKWEPNKIIWYINNVPVRIETSQTSIIPTVAMTVIANSGLSEFEAPTQGNLPEVFPNDMEIDYIRVYQRANHSLPDVVFSINEQQSTSPTSPIAVPSTSIFLDGSQSYVPGHAYSVYIQRCDASGNAIGSDYGRVLTAAEVSQIDRLNIRTFGLSVGCIITPGYNYRVKLAGNSPWTELSQFITATSCTNSANFKVNGFANTIFPTAITVNHNEGKPRVILDLSAVVSCNNTYTVSVQQCNALGTGSGTIYTKTLTSAEMKFLSGLDVEYAVFGGAFMVQGTSYLVKVSCGSPAVTQSQVISIASCTTTTNFKINGNDVSGINSISNGMPIILDASGNTFCQNSATVRVVKCNSSGTPIGAEIQEVRNVPGYYLGAHVYVLGNYDIRDLCQRKGLSIECNNYYRIVLTSGMTITSKIIYIMSCPWINNDYMINNVDASEYHFNISDPITLYSPNSLSCNNHYFVSVQKRQSGVLVGPEAMGWLSTMDAYELTELGIFDLKNFARIHGIEMQDNTTYRVKFVADAGGCNASSWVENNKIIYIGTGSGKPAGSGENVSVEELSDGIAFSIYPNPSSGTMTVALPENSEQAVITFYDLAGKAVHTTEVSKSNPTIDGQALATGVYYVKCQTQAGSFVQKLEIAR